MARIYLDIAFPTAVRSLFTYHISDENIIVPGVRVWVPIRSEYAIGMVVRVHREEPEFETRPIEKVLDSEPIMNESMLQLTEWIHRFYFCSWGDAIQAALPVGLNFSSIKTLVIQPEKRKTAKGDLLKLMNEIESEVHTLKDAEKRWRDHPWGKLLKKAIKEGFVQVWEQPRQKVDYKKIKHWKFSKSMNPEKIADQFTDQERSPKWVEAFLILSEMNLPLPHRELVKKDLFTPYTLNRIEKEGWIESVDLPVSMESGQQRVYEPDRLKTLSGDQITAYERIKESLDEEVFSSFLLYGVTGSGKTEVYIHALKYAMEMGRGGLVLVPEIALTPQTVQRFYQIFGDEIAVLHSRLSDRERFEAWQLLKSGERKIAIGPRSAVFAPVSNLGLIVVDEEHDSSYKQFDPAPRYHARDVAVMRGFIEGSVVILGSATPGMVSIRAVQEKKHTMLQLPLRPTGSMPKVVTHNLAQYKNAMKGPLTIELYQEIKKALEREEQIILLYNRRGFASYLQCENCGHIPQSPESSTSLTYHKKKNILLDHYSGYSRRADRQCEKCGSFELTSKGSGTQQIEEEIERLFPDARLLRMDRDSTSGKFGHQKIYENFLNRESDILIGTQLVAKGLDFPNVTVVGVISADTELAFPSFRAGERMFQLLSQVAGRAGRAEKPGVVYVQTWKPDHPAIHAAQNHDFKSFAKQELASRKKLMFPPYSRMVVFQFKSPSREKVEQVAFIFCDAVGSVLGQHTVMGPSPSVIEWMSGQFQWEAHIKLSRDYNAQTIEQIIQSIFDQYQQIKPKGASSVRINVDVDAIE